MLQRFIVPLIMLLLLAISVHAQQPQQPSKPTEKPAQQTSDPQEKSKYEILLEKAKQQDPSLNFTELRLAFYESPNYNPLAPMMTYRPLSASIAQKNYEQALKIAESVLGTNFVEVNAHMAAHIAYQETGNTERAQLHKFMVDGLLNSIKSSGDGKSTATAFHVISINEEYGLLRSLGLRPVGQALVRDKGHVYDSMTVIDPQTNQQSNVLFNVDKPFNWEAPKKKP